LITHQVDQAIEVCDLIQELLISLVRLRLQVLNVVFQLGFLEFTERSHDFLVNFVDQVDINGEMAVLHDFREKSILEVVFVASKVECFRVLKSRD
jgi:hypothetical protein